jgi:hypothetical protein
MNHLSSSAAAAAAAVSCYYLKNISLCPRSREQRTKNNTSEELQYKLAIDATSS